jgi:hypothetical protein
MHAQELELERRRAKHDDSMFFSDLLNYGGGDGNDMQASPRMATQDAREMSPSNLLSHFGLADPASSATTSATGSLPDVVSLANEQALSNANDIFSGSMMFMPDQNSHLDGISPMPDNSNTFLDLFLMLGVSNEDASAGSNINGGGSGNASPSSLHSGRGSRSGSGRANNNLVYAHSAGLPFGNAATSSPPVFTTPPGSDSPMDLLSSVAGYGSDSLVASSPSSAAAAENSPMPLAFHYKEGGEE